MPIRGALGVARPGDASPRLPSIRTSPVDAAQHAEQRQQQLALALAVEAAEADHLAGAHATARCRCSRSVQLRLAHLEHRRARRSRPRGGLGGNTLLYSRPIISSTTSLSVLRAGREGRDVAAVAEHRAVVGELGDLVHAVRDVEERQPFAAQPLQHGEDLA